MPHHFFTIARVAFFLAVSFLFNFNCTVDHTADFSQARGFEDTASNHPQDSVPLAIPDSNLLHPVDTLPVKPRDSTTLTPEDSIRLIEEMKTQRHVYHVYYGSLHNHCNISNAIGTPEQAYLYARDKAHLDFFGIADHDGSFTPEIWTYLKAVANTFNVNNVFAAFWGFEWTECSYGHIAVVNSDDYCTVVDSATNTFLKMCSWIDKRDYVAFFNHPGLYNSLGTEFEHFNTPVVANIVGMELWNKDLTFPVFYYTEGYDSNDNHKGFFDEALSRGWKIGAAGGSDNHEGTWGTSNDFRLAILSDSLSRNHLLEAMKARRFYSTLDKNMSLSFTLNNQEMGSTIKSGNATFAIHAEDGNMELFSEVILFNGNHQRVRVWQLATGAVFLLGTLTTHTGDYYYVKIRQQDGDEAISSPLWISDATH